jgi:hypothetical protein
MTSVILAPSVPRRRGDTGEGNKPDRIRIRIRSGPPEAPAHLVPSTVCGGSESGCETDSERRATVPEPVRGSDSVHIDAAPDVVWNLISDVTRMGEWSPETYAASWTGSESRPVVGARFAGKNRHGWARWTGRCEVTVAEPAREFAFVRRGPDGGTTWRYVLETEDRGTKVTESFNQAKLPPLPLRLFGTVAFGSDRQALLLESVRTSLQRMKEGAEQTRATNPGD